MLTQRQHQLLQFIHGYLRDHGVPPSFEEMRSAGRVIVSGQDAAELYTTYGVPPEELGRFYAGRTVLGQEVLPEHVAAAVFRAFPPVASGVEWPSRHPDDPTDFAGAPKHADDGTAYVARRPGDGDRELALFGHYAPAIACAVRRASATTGTRPAGANSELPARVPAASLAPTQTSGAC